MFHINLLCEVLNYVLISDTELPRGEVERLRLTIVRAFKKIAEGLTVQEAIERGVWKYNKGTPAERNVRVSGDDGVYTFEHFLSVEIPTLKVKA